MDRSRLDGNFWLLQYSSDQHNVASAQMFCPVHHEGTNFAGLFDHDALDCSNLLTKYQENELDTHVADMMQSASEGDFLSYMLFCDCVKLNASLGISSGGLHQWQVTVSCSHLVRLNSGSIFKPHLTALFGIISMFETES